MSADLAQVLRTFGPAFLREHALTSLQAQVWRDVAACRTPALGGRQQPLFNSCRNRHCPTCQTREQEAWRQARLGELLDVPYCHLVFTLPHEINPLAHVHAHPRWVYRTLMECVASTQSCPTRCEPGAGAACPHRAAVQFNPVYQPPFTSGAFAWRWRGD